MTPSDQRLNRGRRVRSFEETNEIFVSPPPPSTAGCIARLALSQSRIDGALAIMQ
jgi:hypothetical protein